MKKNWYTHFYLEKLSKINTQILCWKVEHNESKINSLYFGVRNSAKLRVPLKAVFLFLFVVLILNLKVVFLKDRNNVFSDT